MYSDWRRDFLCGYVLQKMPSNVGNDLLVRALINGDSQYIVITSIEDYLTINEIFNWQIYKPGPKYAHEITSCLDLGGNIGLASVYLDKVLNLNSIVLVEPLGSIQSTLGRNLATLKADTHVINCCVVPDNFQDKECQMNLSKGSRYASLADATVNAPTEIVATIRCTDLVKVVESKIASPDLVKIDIEGLGTQVGMQLVLNFAKRPLLIFIEEDEEQLVEFDRFMCDVGYSTIFRLEGFRKYELKSKNL